MPKQMNNNYLSKSPFSRKKESVKEKDKSLNISESSLSPNKERYSRNKSPHVEHVNKKWKCEICDKTNIMPVYKCQSITSRFYFRLP